MVLKTIYKLVLKCGGYGLLFIYSDLMSKWERRAINMFRACQWCRNWGADKRIPGKNAWPPVINGWQKLNLRTLDPNRSVLAYEFRVAKNLAERRVRIRVASSTECERRQWRWASIFGRRESDPREPHMYCTYVYTKDIAWWERCCINEQY